MKTPMHDGLMELQQMELVQVYGGFTGSGPLAQDVGRVVGGAVGFLLRIGESFYRSGGLTGGNPWLK